MLNHRVAPREFFSSFALNIRCATSRRRPAQRRVPGHTTAYRDRRRRSGGSVTTRRCPAEMEVGQECHRISGVHADWRTLFSTTS